MAVREALALGILWSAGIVSLPPVEHAVQYARRVVFAWASRAFARSSCELTRDKNCFLRQINAKRQPRRIVLLLLEPKHGAQTARRLFIVDLLPRA